MIGCNHCAVGSVGIVENVVGENLGEEGSV